jgi:phage baseplate assembly protein W
MANGKTYGITFPFRDSFDGRYLDLTDTSDEEIRSDLIHLLLTRKGSRYFLPDFGSRIYEYIFEPLDGPTFSEIEAEIRDAVNNFIPNLIVTDISITPAEEENRGFEQVNRDPYLNDKVYRVPGQEEIPYTAIVRIDYIIQDSTFNTRDFIILNI